MRPPTVRRPGRRSGRGHLVALLAAPLLAVSLLGAAGSSNAATAPASTPAASTGADAAAADPAAVGTREVTLITGDTVHYTGAGEGQVTFDVEPAPRGGGSKVTFSGEGDAENFYVLPSDAEKYIDTGVVDRELFNIPHLIEQGLDDATTGKLPVIVTYAADGKAVAQKRRLSTRRLERDADALPATRDAVGLRTVQGAGVKVDRGKAEKFWAAVAGGAARAASLSRGVARVLLDERLELDLDESVPQIRAPEVWESGYTGEGVTVGVLDTGIDGDHPDVAGQVADAKNFSDEADTSDNHGHGTHVASTVAGTGEASDGRYSGVAPDGDLLIGKVCDAGGSCPTSAIVAGMEWVTGNGADIVNMSLSGGATDGTDLLSQTLNDLSAATDTLFVVSAGNGNGGPDRPHNVGTPGAADAALTVGAVDKSDKLAGFSSRGPRKGDHAVKPNITAPGVDITAARAGSDGHRAMSGTSMSAPHMAGAAALLAQAKPDLDADALKDALASTAVDGGYGPFEQGTGRADIARAVAHDVYGPASVDFGDMDGADGPAERELTYTNHTDTPVTLTLDSALTNIQGEPAKGLTLSADTITVPANDQASLTATADSEASGEGIFNGVITATADGVSLRTGVGFGGVDLHTVTVKVLDHNGEPACDGCVVGGVRLYDGTPWEDVQRKYQYRFGLEDGVATGRVPTATFAVMAAVNEPGGGDFPKAVRLLVELDVAIDSDVTITLDAREAVKLAKPAVPSKDTQVRGSVYSLCLEQPFPPGDDSHGHHWCRVALDTSGNQWVTQPAYDVYVTPTPQPKSLSMYLWERWMLAEPRELSPVPHMPEDTRLYSAAPEYLYNVPFLYTDGIPDTSDPANRRFAGRDLVEVPVRYHADQPDTLIVKVEHPRPPFPGAWGTPWLIHEPGAVTEYYRASDQFTWGRSDYWRYVPDAGSPRDRVILYTYDAFPASEAGGRRDEERRFEAPIRHGVPERSARLWEVINKLGRCGSPRDLPCFTLRSAATIPANMARGGADGTEFSPAFTVTDNSGLHRWGGRTAHLAFKTSWRMWNEDTGEELELGEANGGPVFRGLDTEAATYRLEETFAYPDWMAPYFRTKPTATTNWTFQSQKSDAKIPEGYKCWPLDPPHEPGATCQLQALIQLRYELGLDINNRAPAGRTHIVTIHAGHHAEAIDRAEVTDLTLQVSFDGGETWEDARPVGKLTGNRSTAEQSRRFAIKHPPLDRTDGYVALRVKGADANGGTVESETQRAYILK